MEARPTLTLDTTGRLWIAWEEGGANWGKDNGYWFSTRNLGIPLGAQRRIQVRAQVSGEWREPAAPLTEAFPGNNYHPEVFSDGRGSIWLSAIRTVTARAPGANAQAANAASHFEYWVSHLDGNTWSKPWPLPHA